MKTVIIHGQSHKGSTYHIAHEIADKTGGETSEFFLPRDFGAFCLGCNQCFRKGESFCSHRQQLEPIFQAMMDADVIILASPVYVYHATGAMKAFLDHLGWLWMAHRPDVRMFSKQGVCVSTAAGSGTKSTNKDMADSLFFWGVPKIYKCGVNVAAVSWDAVNEKKKACISACTSKIAEKIKKNHGKVKPGIKTKGFFAIMRKLNLGGSWNEIDTAYWKERGWLGKNRPWKNLSEKK